MSNDNDNKDRLTQGDDDSNTNGLKKSRSKNQLSTMMRRIKNPATRRRSAKQRDRDPSPAINFRKAQSVISIRPRRSAPRHARSSSDFGTYVISDVEANRNRDEDNIVSTSITKKQGVETSDDNASDILLVSSSVSEEDTITVKSNSDSDLNGNSTFQSFYNMVTSSWRPEEDDKENAELDNGSQLIRRNSVLMIDGSSSESSVQFFLKEDFDSSIWSEVNATNGISIFGAAVMTATVVIHPLVFVAGAATAVWAVGALHAAEKG